MSYVPKTWETGEVINASDLNHMENAIGAFYVTIDRSAQPWVLMASYNEILSEISKGKLCAYIDLPTGVIYYLDQLAEIEGHYEASFCSFGDPNTTSFGSESADENMVVSLN